MDGWCKLYKPLQIWVVHYCFDNIHYNFSQASKKPRGSSSSRPRTARARRAAMRPPSRGRVGLGLESSSKGRFLRCQRSVADKLPNKMCTRYSKMMGMWSIDKHGINSMVLTATTWGISYWSCRIIAEAWLSLGHRPTQKGWGICKRLPRKNIDRFSSLITNQSNFPSISRYLPLGPHFLHHFRWAAYQSPSSRPGCSSRHPGPAWKRETSPAAAGSGTARFCRLHLWPWMSQAALCPEMLYIPRLHYPVIILNGPSAYK